MKITSLEIVDYPPIKNLKIENLGSVVIIAGTNGSGKTRLKQAIVQTLQGSPLINIKISATREEEVSSFGGDTIESQKGQVNQTLVNYINSRRYGRGNYVGSLVQIDSQRIIQTVQYSQIPWQQDDPDNQETPGTFYYGEFSSRWQDFINYIHRKAYAYDRKLLEELKSNPAQSGIEIFSRNPHPYAKYKKIFREILPGKELQDIDPSNVREFMYKDVLGNLLNFGTLSSGEQEIVKILFDVARKDIKDSVIIVDEPELHLHPTLTFKLIENLKSIGDHTNQFIFLTHSADLISTYYSTGDVYFIDSEQSGANQAHKLSDLDRTHKELVNLIGENLGLFAVGKKLVFVEGENSSIDRLTYHTIAQKYLPEAKIIPVGSVMNIVTLNTFEEQIRNSIFGIDFYMIRDRDGLTETQIQLIEEKGRIKCLKKRHIENYFLDSEVLYGIAKNLYITTLKPELNEEYIQRKIKDIAVSSLSLNLLQNTKEHLELNYNFNIPTVRAITGKSLQDIKAEMSSNVSKELSLLTSALSSTNLKQWMNDEQVRLENALSSGSWLDEFQGKDIFSRLCSEVFGEDKLKIRQAYVDYALDNKPDVFGDIRVIFENFNDR